MAKATKAELLEEAANYGEDLDPEMSYSDVLDEVKELREIVELDAEEARVEAQVFDERVPDDPEAAPADVEREATPPSKRGYPFDELGRYIGSY